MGAVGVSCVLPTPVPGSSNTQTPTSKEQLKWVMRGHVQKKLTMSGV